MVEKLKEQIYVIPLDDVKHTPRWERSKRSVKAVRDFLARHMKSEDIKLDPGISRKLWERGAHKRVVGRFSCQFSRRFAALRALETRARPRDP